MADTRPNEAAPGRTSRGSARQQAILGLLDEDSRVDVADIANAFKVTTETVRRDLIALERAGLARRVHGGALRSRALKDSLVVPPLDERSGMMAAEKRRIARVAHEFLPKEGLIVLDAGSTVAELAKLIQPDVRLSIVCIGIPTAVDLVARGVKDVHLVGGELVPRTLATNGDWALRALSDLSADVAFVGASGVSAARGATTTSHSDSMTKRAVLACARSRVLLADSTKLGVAYVSRFAQAPEFDAIITDDGGSAREAKELAALGVSVLGA